RRPMDIGCTTCARTCTNGARTGTIRVTTASRRWRIHEDLQMERVEHLVAGHGGTTLRLRDAPRGAASLPNSAMQIMGSGWHAMESDQSGDVRRGCPNARRSQLASFAGN